MTPSQTIDTAPAKTIYSTKKTHLPNEAKTRDPHTATTTTLTRVTNISFHTSKFPKQTWLLSSIIGQQLSKYLDTKLPHKSSIYFLSPAFFWQPLFFHLHFVVVLLLLAGLSGVIASPLNARDRGLFASIYVFSLQLHRGRHSGCQNRAAAAVPGLMVTYLTSPCCLPCTVFFLSPDSLQSGGLYHLAVLGQKVLFNTWQAPAATMPTSIWRHN